MSFNYHRKANLAKIRTAADGNNSVAAHPLFMILLGLGLITAASPLLAEDYFNPLALEIDEASSGVDIERFSQSGNQLPGTYLVTLTLNGNQIDSREVNFIQTDGRLLPEFSPAQLAELGLKVDAFPALNALEKDKPISDYARYVPDVNSQFNFAEQRLDLSIPQAALNEKARGYVDPELWDQGLPSLLMNYNFSGAKGWQKNQPESESRYLNLRSGANLGAWRLRNYSTYSESSGIRRWDNVNTTLQRDIQRLKSQFTLGDSATPGEIFDSIQYRGVQLASDDNMYPDSLKGFAPVVRGIARGNAQVTVRQNGFIIYQTYVAAGPFAITDLYPTSSNGELEVTITEADGTERRLVQPFSAVPVMVREGRVKYSATAGTYRSTTPGGQTPNFVQSTLIYGLPLDTTVYGGTIAANNYSSLALGIGKSLGDIGSLSADVTQARSHLYDDSRRSGQSLRLQYGKEIESTNTSFTLAGYRYSTSGFYDFKEANEIGALGEGAGYRGSNKRSRVQLNVSQSFNNWGSIYLNAYQQDYWGREGIERNLSGGYNVSYNGISYSLAYTRSQLPGNNGTDQQFAFSLQVPLSKWLPGAWASYDVTTSKQGGTRHQAGLNGTALANDNLSYSLQQSYARRNEGGAGSASANYRGTYGEVSAGYNYTSETKQINYGLDGGIVAHPYGVTLTQQQGESLALVRAPDASGVSIQNEPGVKTDWRGYAVVPYVSSYRLNRIALDTETLGEEVDITETVQNVVPTRGALVLADFPTRSGSRVLFNLAYQGKPVPFGATAAQVVSKGQQENSSIVGDGGQVFISGMPDNGELKVQWGNGQNQQCRVDFRLPEATVTSSVRELAATCK